MGELHVGVGAVGFEVVATSGPPPLAPAMQKLVETQEMELIPPRPKLGVLDHIGGAAVGFVVVSTSPLLLPATQSVVELHVTAFREWVSIAAGALQVGLALVGLVEMTS